MFRFFVLLRGIVNESHPRGGYFYQYLTIECERYTGKSRSQCRHERATDKGWHIQTGGRKKPYRANCRMFLHLEIGSSKPIEVKTKTRDGLERKRTRRASCSAESTDKARKSIKVCGTNLDRNFVVCCIDAKKTRREAAIERSFMENRSNLRIQIPLMGTKYRKIIARDVVHIEVRRLLVRYHELVSIFRNGHKIFQRFISDGMIWWKELSKNCLPRRPRKIIICARYGARLL